MAISNGCSPRSPGHRATACVGFTTIRLFRRKHNRFAWTEPVPTHVTGAFTGGNAMMKGFVAASVALGIGVITGAFPVVLPSQLHLHCESASDGVTPLDVNRTGDRWHLRNDVETAEEVGVRHGDSRR